MDINTTQTDSKINNNINETTSTLSDRIVKIKQTMRRTDIDQQTKMKIINELYKINNETDIICAHDRLNVSDLHYLCCSKVFSCYECHLENASTDKCFEAKQNIKTVECNMCYKTQSPRKSCESCVLCFSNYFCSICKIWSDRTLFHCNKCGICKLKDPKCYFHCDNCESCFPIEYKKSHKCSYELVREEIEEKLTMRFGPYEVEEKIKTNITKKVYKSIRDDFCLFCKEKLHTTFKNPFNTKCGHFFHEECINKYLNKDNYKCIVCRKTLMDMKTEWGYLETSIYLQPMNEIRIATFSCNDCGVISEDEHHFLGQKCSYCQGYNTTILSLGELISTSDELSNNTNNLVPITPVTTATDSQQVSIEIEIKDEDEDSEQQIEQEEQPKEDEYQNDQHENLQQMDLQNYSDSDFSEDLGYHPENMNDFYEDFCDYY